jgi:hypothetical protein
VPAGDVPAGRAPVASAPVSPAAARSTAERVRHARARLATDVDLWAATASADGVPYLVPLSFLWRDGRIVMATVERSTAVRNLRGSGEVRLSLDGLRDVVLVDGTAGLLPLDGIDAAVADAYAAHAGWDPRDDAGNVWVVVTPVRIRSWREVNELPGRLVMRDGAWLA